MPYSARALGQKGLRLRPRRVRTERSTQLSVYLVALGVVVASLVGFIGAGVADTLSRLPTFSVPGWVPGPSAPPPPPRGVEVGPEEQAYARSLWPIHVRLEQSAARMGLVAAAYVGGDVTAVQLKTDVEEALAAYRRSEEQVRALQEPPELRERHSAYLATLRLFEQSAVELLKMYEDGDADHLVVALPLSLEASTRMRKIGDQLWPR